MEFIDNELVVCFDVDDTLIRSNAFGALNLPYGGRIKNFEPILEHVELLREYKARGFTVIVWSMGGSRWAKTVVESLKLERFVDYVMCKPSKHVDDKSDVGSIIGTRVFIAEKE